ncbi:unnamed protein product, partial [Timema podura]|nr:unnamed protein product [Timema podura]
MKLCLRDIDSNVRHSDMILKVSEEVSSATRDGVEKHIFESDEIYVRVGSTKWNHGGQIYDVDDRLRHQKYVTYGIKDIAIIKV